MMSTKTYYKEIPVTDNEWPLEADFSDIRPMTPEERKASLDRDAKNNKKEEKND